MLFIEKFSGASASYSLRHRVFNLFLFFGGVAGVVDLILRVFFQQSITQIAFSILISIVFIVSYYVIRVKNHFSDPTILISAIFILLALSFSFFFNSGTDGKVIPLLLFSMTVYFLSAHKPLVYLISLLHIVSIITILLLQYLHPAWIVSYPNEKERLIDNLANIAYIVLIMYFILSIMRREFEKERANLREKDNYLNQQNQLIQDLLKELNHRVKNNLQVVTALLSLQAYRSRNPYAISALEEGKNRLISMSILHKKLYQDNFFNQISLKEYIDDLVEHVLSGIEETVEVEKDIEDMMLTADQAIPLGLILNEIFTGLVHHAFEPGAESPVIKIRSEFDKPLLTIFIRDNGTQLIAEATKMKESGVSMELIDMLIKQLDGTFNVHSVNPQGAEIRIKFTLK